MDFTPVPVVMVAFVLACAATPLVRWLALRWQLLDLPNDRSSHVRATPRAGGLALLLGVGGAVLLFRPSPSAEWVAVMAGALVVAGVGLVDDRYSLSPLSRLSLQVTAAVLVVATAGGLERLPAPPPIDVSLGVAGVPLAVLWIVAVLNFYNFMDGIDGLAATQAAVTGVGLWMLDLDPHISALGAAIAGASVGFLIYNWSPATIFLGDVGSGSLGFALAAVPFLVPAESRPETVGFVALSLWFFLADTVFTLLHRITRGERFWAAHREHLYQAMVIAGWSHARVTCLLGAGALAMTALAVLAWQMRTAVVTWVIIAFGTLLFAAEYYAARTLTRRIK